MLHIIVENGKVTQVVLTRGAESDGDRFRVRLLEEGEDYDVEYDKPVEIDG